MTFLRRHWVWIALALLVTGSGVNVLAQGAGIALVIAGLAFIGLTAVVAVEAYVSGSTVVKHSHTYRDSRLGRSNRKELEQR